ncbi:unnamed protein product [Rangifer tarandus platyrhynchus]|uniref:Uncharacterized protein n=1 Tax=Rangifer tarandus platyrhynchus TaxID=3082113 RepID=A0ABN8ZD08_RANTA|nr:unnamed protein product [Rangifer tarandus platyrhynchus]CAI9689244.1 unnamed protein product [Rangifer tarandus platyrhynchus]
MKTAGKVLWDMHRRKAWGCGKADQREKQVHRSFAGVAAGTGRGQGPLRDQDCRERQAGITQSPRHGGPVPLCAPVSLRASVGRRAPAGPVERRERKASIFRAVTLPVTGGRTRC